MGKTKKYKHDAECNFDTTVECLVVLVNITMVGDETSHNNLGSIIEKCRNACLKKGLRGGELRTYKTMFSKCIPERTRIILKDLKEELRLLFVC